MDTIQLIVGSSFVGAVVSFLATFLSARYMQNMSYRQDYYKKVIDKRIQSYEDAYHAVNYLQIINIGKSGKKSHASLINRRRYSDFMVTMGVGTFKGLWLSKEASIALTDLNQLLFNKLGHFDESGDTDDIDPEMEKIAEENYDAILAKKDSIRNQVLKDMQNLYDIQGFLKSKQS
jgi:hypothetical protein